MNGLQWLIDSATACGEFGLEQALIATLPAGLLLVGVLLINGLLRRWLSANQKCLLWSVVLLRLIIPVGPASALSLQNLLQSALAVTSGSDVAVEQVASSSLPLEDAAPPAAPVAGYSQGTDQQSAGPAWDDGLGELLSAWLPLVWLAVAVISLAGTVVGHWRLSRRIRQILPSVDQRLGLLWAESCQRAGVRRSIPIVQFDSLGQPAVLGLIRPKLLLPGDATDLSDDQLRMVMLHELAHVRRWDIAANWLLVVIRAAQWWNPVYWIAAARYRAQREQACDAWVIRQVGTETTHGYGELLLKFAQRQPSGPLWRVTLPASILGLCPALFRRGTLRGRLKALRFAGVTRSPQQTVGVAGLMALVAIAGLTDASVPKQAPNRSSEWLPPADHEWAISITAEGSDDGPIVTRSYDIQQALDQIAVHQTPTDNARRNLEWQLENLLRHLNLDGGPARRILSDEEKHELLTFRGQPPEAIAIEGHTLTVSTTEGVHAEIARRIAAWEESGLGQVCIEMVYLTDDRDLASDVGAAWRYLETFSNDADPYLPSQRDRGKPAVRAQVAVEDYLPVVVAPLDDQQVRALFAAGRGKGTRAPKITIFNGTQATLAETTQTPFVVGIEDAAGGAEQPKIVIIEDGVRLTLRATQNRDRKTIRLQGRLDVSTLGEVDEVPTLFHGERSRIQIPHARRWRIDVSAEVADGQSLLVGCVPSLEQKSFFYLLLTPRGISELEEGAIVAQPD